MGRELYQLVAIDKNNNQYVIELNNENVKNKSNLEFIDRGTARFRDEKHLAEYLYQKGKIPTTDVAFSIKYRHNGDKYLPVIYNDRELRLYLGLDELGKYDHIVRLFVLTHMEFSKLNFLNFFITENKHNSNQANNGNYLNDKLFFDLINYYDTYVKNENSNEGKANLQFSILTQLSNYKQFRTLYQFHKSYSQNFKNIEEEVTYKTSQNNTCNFNNDSKDVIKSETIYSYYENLPNIPDDIRHAYETNGMDGVYGIVDLDDLEAKGIVDIDNLGLNKRRFR